jgi:hypothetical protein
MADKKDTGDEDVSGDVTTLLVEGTLGLRTQLTKNIHDTGERHKDFFEGTKTAFQGKTKSNKVK